MFVKKEAEHFEQKKKIGSSQLSKQIKINISGNQNIQIVEKINSNNYYILKFKVKMLLIEEEPFEIITSPPDPKGQRRIVNHGDN